MGRQAHTHAWENFERSDCGCLHIPRINQKSPNALTPVTAGVASGPAVKLLRLLFRFHTSFRHLLYLLPPYFVRSSMVAFLVVQLCVRGIERIHNIVYKGAVHAHWHL
jgi:hypothetical protein